MKNHSTKYFSVLIGIIIATTALLGIVLIANAAPQHWINVSATACQKSGNVEVKYIATSWATGDDGTNTDVSFQYQVLRSDGTASDYITVTSSDDGSNFSLSSDNNYTIAGTLYLGAEVTNVSLVFTTLVNWNSGYEGGQMAYITVPVQNCDQTTSDPVTPETYRVFMTGLHR